MNKIEALIARHEGLRLQAYRDSVGKLTIGYGRNLDDVGITRHEAEAMLALDVERVYADLSRFDWFKRLDAVREAVIVNMVFNLGINRFSRFKKTIQHIERADYGLAAAEMLDSKWAKQVGNRANELSKMMASGEWV